FRAANVHEGNPSAAEWPVSQSGPRVVLLKHCGRSSRRSRGGRLYVRGSLVTEPVAHHPGGRHCPTSETRRRRLSASADVRQLSAPTTCRPQDHRPSHL